MERISVFDIFKIGVGPSSSHTIGPWRAARAFTKSLETNDLLLCVKEIETELFGSLAKTGKGHGTDIAILLGLLGEDPVTTDVNTISSKVALIKEEKHLLINNKHTIPFDPARKIVFNFKKKLPYHSNALKLTARLSDDSSFEEIYYSIGGGFVVKEGQQSLSSTVELPYPIDAAGDLLKWTQLKNLSVAEVVFENEKVWRTPDQIQKDIINIWNVMKECTFRGCHVEGILPGGLKVNRRAASINNTLMKGRTYSGVDEWMNIISKSNHSFREIIDWVGCFALAVNEENASFGRVVTAPTNGAAGVIPAVLMYYLCFCENNGVEDIIKFLLVSGELGSIFKKGSTISAAMGGCQAEIGVSSAMAAGALTACLGGKVDKILMAAEIAMEHHLGLTCDPVAGLVQIPCIERNVMGAMKAITATELALSSDSNNAKVSLDAVIKTMWDTARDMKSKYKETSDGGLAVNISVNMSEC